MQPPANSSVKKDVKLISESEETQFDEVNIIIDKE
jgi:hypothetical protein